VAIARLDLLFTLQAIAKQPLPHSANSFFDRPLSAGTTAVITYPMPVPTAPLFKSLSPSSRVWLSNHFSDPYVKSRLSHPAQFRSRSAFKLLELHEKYGNFLTRNVDTVVDLGAAPGGWSQVVAGKMGWTEQADMESAGAVGRGMRRHGTKAGLRNEGGETKQSASWSEAAIESEKRQDPYEMFYGPGDQTKKPQVGRGAIVAVDLLRIPPIPGVRTLQIDFLSPQAGDLIRAMLMSPSNPEGKADLILSDMAANFTGNRAHDVEASLDICLAVFAFVKKNLRTVEETGKKYAGSLLCVHISFDFLLCYAVDYHLKHFSTASSILRIPC
jgi:23S rRNA (uridine2552-2'-O)-methyltransferase